MTIHKRSIHSALITTLLAVATCLFACDDARTQDFSAQDANDETEHDGHAHDDGQNHAHEEVAPPDDFAGPPMGPLPPAADEHAGHDHEEHDEHGHHDETIISLTAAELEEFSIRVETAGPQPIEIRSELSGEVVMNPDSVAHVVARAAGIAERVHKTVGDAVEAGEAMAELESPALAEAKAEYLSRVREYALAQTDLARAETIYANTRRLLEFLSETPSLDALREFAELDLGANRNTLVSTYAQLVAAEAAFERDRSLFEKQIGSEAEFLEAESVYKQAQAAFLSVRDDLAFSNERTLDQRRRETKVAEVVLHAAERRLHSLGLSQQDMAEVPQQSDTELAGYVIHAPIAGMVTQRHIVRGEKIDEGTDVFTVADLDTVWIALTVYQKDLPMIQVGQDVQIVASYDIARASGTIDYINPVIDEATRTTTARIVLANPDRKWLPGMFVEGSVELEQIDASVVVPRDAIQTVDDQTVVFVQGEQGFEPTPVELGRGDRRSVIVLSGLKQGQRYAASNTFTLKSELGRAGLEHAGHVH